MTQAVVLLAVEGQASELRVFRLQLALQAWRQRLGTGQGMTGPPRLTAETDEDFRFVGGLPTRQREAGGRNTTTGILAGANWSSDGWSLSADARAVKNAREMALLPYAGAGR